MSLSFYSSLMTADGDAPNHDEQPQFTALNLFAALATNHLKYYTPWQLNVHHFNDRVELAGKGGSAVVEIGQLRKFRVKREANNQQFVAVKRSRALAAAAGSLDEKVILRHFEQLTMEIRIMGNSTLRKHANIVDILGVCVDVINAIPSLALVLEHSDLGSLDLFLVTGDGKGTTELERVDMALQVAEGLTALHGLGICHADVKTQNALVFQKSNHDSWLIKISDFGNSVIGVHGNARARVRCHIGTRLLNAPEIRNGSALRDPLFSIEDALRTDVFSFGLLVWEVLKCGQSFLDSAWIGNAAGASSIDEIEDVLNTLNHNALRDSAVNFLNGLELGDELRARLSRIFRGALDDNPSDRVTMVTLRDLLREERELEPYKQFANSLDDLPGGIPADETSRVEDINNELLGLEPLYEDSMGTWTAQHSLYELLSHCGFDGNRIIQEMPTTIKKQILEELEIVASATSVPNNIRAGAAMTLSECYTIGFGSNLDNDKAVRWLRTSASLGSTKAALWYRRVCCATGINPATSELVSDIGQDLEQQLSSLPSVLYLAERIRRLNFQVQESAKKVTLIARRTPSPAARLEDAAFKLSIFNPDEVDDLSPLHLACWLGDNELCTLPA
ncbi:hypothetical protein CGLO_09981 [Colletotrichum gloeosporioides Cg-14]|uniref:Protein kinase domain-containing protein n=1 Tax=Colletotrichum gloeosporioides (strain Cg-14) TaxID=1237896 RepID=T0KEQ1_COLGC|nr:hypothetical protein CGLO_09981 [Colletotrichum gloeosporioides Cg-14]